MCAYLKCKLMKTLTIFTPTYNRVKLLNRGYLALCSQTSFDFCWLIIDDGSTDSTSDLVKSWLIPESISYLKDGFIGFSMDAPCLKIRYCYKENGGLHTGYNKAIELIETELCVCIDSDDFMPENAVEKIVHFWKQKGNPNVAGILGLDFFLDGKPIGGYFPEGIESLHIIDMESKYGHYGDVKVVHRTQLLKQVAPQPVFEGEKNFNPIYLFNKIDMYYPLLLLNENLCFVEYQEGGMTSSIYKQYVNSPMSFSELRRLLMSRRDVSLAFKFRQAIHYVSSEIRCRNTHWLRDSPEKCLTLIAVPLGFLLFVYINYKSKK